MKERKKEKRKIEREKERKNKETRPDTRHKSFAVFVSARQKKRLRTDRPTDQRTDGPTHPLIESCAHD